MKKQIRAIAAVAAATMLLTGCAAHKQNNTSEQTPTTQTQSNTASSVSTETTPARENWSLLDHLPKWSDGTVTPAVTADPNSGIPFWENPLNDDDWTKSLSLDGAPNFNGVNVSLDVNIEIFSSGEKAAETGSDSFLTSMAKKFNTQRNTTSDGKTMSVSLRSVPSGTAAEYISTGKYQPECYTPSNTLFGELVKNEGVELTVETDRLVGNVAGILVSKKTGDMLRTDYGEASVNTVLNATIDGKMMMGYSNPYTSATGLNFLLSALASGGNDNIVDTAAVENFQKFQANVPLVSFTTQQMVQSADKGVVDGLVMEYQSYQNDPTLQRNYEFIPFGVRHDNPLYSIGNISAEKKEVIAAFVSLCAQNQAEATKDGFNGLDDYAYTGKVYDGNTIAQAQSVWKEEKDSGIPIVAEFVVDTSGSMRGEPINALKTAMINTIQYINDDNYIGIIGFDSDVREYLPIDQFSLTQKTLYKGAVNSLDANGNTAMYNGLCVAMDRIYKKSQELGGNCTPIIFVLTDGDSNTGYKFSETKDIIAGMNIPIYTISYNYAADSLSELASINEAASIVGNSEDITYKLRNLFNAEM
jgi:Ca-activated chloride channel family protein